MTLVDDDTDLSVFGTPTWTTACAYDYLIPGRGVGVLLDDGSQAALFRARRRIAACDGEH